LLGHRLLPILLSKCLKTEIHRYGTSRPHLLLSLSVWHDSCHGSRTGLRLSLDPDPEIRKFGRHFRISKRIPLGHQTSTIPAPYNLPHFLSSPQFPQNSRISWMSTLQGFLIPSSSRDGSWKYQRVPFSDMKLRRKSFLRLLQKS